ncbi:MAG TPA: ATP-dependent DNA helicase RecG [Syntrophorhabdaceae bacterium]|nr:ATP-dependent DNA helicase RecG [Syntrophorhabdaceae bacterium]
MRKREIQLNSLRTPLIGLKGIGPKIDKGMEEKGLRTVEDLLYYVPVRYIDRRSVRAIGELSDGEQVNCMGTVMSYRSLFFRHSRKKAYEMVVQDETGTISLKWFQWTKGYLKTICRKGNVVFVSGKVSKFGNMLQLVHPDVFLMDECNADERVMKIIPYYSPIDGIKQGSLRTIVEGLLSDCKDDIISVFPKAVEAGHGLIELYDAIREVHFPESEWFRSQSRHTYMERLILEEYMLFQSVLWLNRLERRAEKGVASRIGGPYSRSFSENLPFQLTNAQKRVIHEIEADMAGMEPMNRLVQGDVGSGKTICAIAASCRAVDSGCQVAFMAPTEILAEQHYYSVHRFFDDLGISVAFLRGNMGKERKAILENIRKGHISVVVGTHAIIQKDVGFDNIGLAVVDEQHRFGVLQRRWLIEKGMHPHMLMLTATPIPRTLSMVLYGDLDVSTIDELPHGRKAILTKVYTDDRKTEVYRMIESEVQQGHQVYIVYPLVAESAKMELLNATDMAQYFQTSIFQHLTVGLLHGAMRIEEKESMMKRFKGGEIDILVCTTVIEVGIDVPNATMIVIEHAERFGLSQLHQLRGRVGRGTDQSHCILVTSSKRTDLASKRLRIMEKTTDGFKIAEEDMLIRGVGDMLGTRQSGIPRFRVGDIIRDMDLMLKAKEICEKSLPLLSASEMDEIRSTALFRWGEALQTVT